jgi:hypothetical protein
LPDAVFAKLVAQDAQVLKEALAKGALDKKTTRKVRATAFMIAVYAQAAMAKGGDKAAALASLRDDALNVAKLAEQGKAAEAAALVAKLSPVGRAGGKAEPVALNKELDHENLMHQFSSERVGGYGIEKELGDMVEEKQALTPAQMERLELLAWKIAMIGQVGDSYADEKDEGGEKTKANWLMFEQHFREAALGMAAAAKGRNNAATLAAVEKLTMTCVKCHDKFR